MYSIGRPTIYDIWQQPNSRMDRRLFYTGFPHLRTTAKTFVRRLLHNMDFIIEDILILIICSNQSLKRKTQQNNSYCNGFTEERKVAAKIVKCETSHLKCIFWYKILLLFKSCYTGKPDDGPYEDRNIQIITKILIRSCVRTDPWLFIWSVYYISKNSVSIPNTVCNVRTY